MSELHFGPMEFAACGVAAAIIAYVAWYRYFRELDFEK